MAYRSEEFDIFLLSPQIVTGPFILLDALPEPILAKNDALVKKKSFFSKFLHEAPLQDKSKWT